jgi:hypothetical protein
VTEIGTPRLLTIDGDSWRVREVDASEQPGARGLRCLIFDSDGVMRRVWVFPGEWRTLSDPDLASLMRRSVGALTPVSPQNSVPIEGGFLHPAIASAAHSVLIAHELLATVRDVRHDNHALRDNRTKLIEACQVRRDEMTRAIRDYVFALKGHGFSESRVLELVADAVSDGFTDQIADEIERDACLAEAVKAGQDAYRAA